MTGETVVAVGQVERGIRVGIWRADLLLGVPAPGEMLSGAARRVGAVLVAERLGVPPPSVRIASLLPSGRPVALGDDGPLGLSVSLSHDRGLVGAVVSADARIGIDIVDPGSVGAGLGHWFDATEQRSARTAPLWAAKEAAYKAAGLDVAFQPGAVTVTDDGPGAFRWTVRSPARAVDGQGAWFAAGRHLVALAGCLAAIPEPAPCS